MYDTKQNKQKTKTNTYDKTKIVSTNFDIWTNLDTLLAVEHL